MNYIDKLIEATANWFMDFFLDPVYVVETSSNRMEAILRPSTAVILTPETTIIKTKVCVSEGEEKFVTTVPVLSAFAIAVHNYINNKVSKNVISLIMQQLILFRFPRYLTG